jgi:hypothetical protein
VLKSLVPTQSSQDKEKFSCPFQSTDNFLEWKLAFIAKSLRMQDGERQNDGYQYNDINPIAQKK